MKALLKELKGIQKIHFVGIGGAGMSPLAKILLLLGYNVSGSDQGTSPIIEELVRLGARVSTDASARRMCAARMPSSSLRRFPTTTPR